MTLDEALRMSVVRLDSYYRKERLLLVALMHWSKQHYFARNEPFVFFNGPRRYTGLVIGGHITVTSSGKNIEATGRVELIIERLFKRDTPMKRGDSGRLLKEMRKRALEDFKVSLKSRSKR